MKIPKYMITRFKLICLVLTAFSFQSFAQTIQELNIPTQNRCAFSGTEWEDELYRFETNSRLQVLVKEILDLAGETQNFEIIQTNVKNVAAIFDPATNKRYLLFSQNFKLKSNDASVYAALAHEIGHHANLHSLTDVRRKVEELEADQFLGYVLQKASLKGVVSLTDAQDVLKILPTSYPSVISAEERNEAVKRGWNRAQELLFILKRGAWASDPNEEAFMRAQFPFPPPPCCSPREIPRTVFAMATKLGDIDAKMRDVLEKQGYIYRKYMSIPNGFAIVTQLEQHNADFTNIEGANRWAGAPVAESFMGYLDYFKRLLMPSKAHFRTFVFLVTSNVFSVQGSNVSKKEATAWYGQAINRLPKYIADMPYTEGVTVTALVYEFEVPESNRKPNQKCPSVDTQRHLDMSGIWKGL